MVWFEPDFKVPLGQRHLFLDDFGIEKITNLKKTMHQPKKKGAVIRPDPEGGCPQIRMAPVWDPKEKVYRLYSYSIYESKDGLQWYKSSVQVKQQPSLIVYDPTESDVERRYKGASPNQGFYTSPDGWNWKMLDVPAVPSSDEYNFSFDEKGHLFILTVKHGGPYGRSIWLSTSQDFEHWTKPELIFYADDLDQELGCENIKARLADPALQQPDLNDPAAYNVDVYNMGVFAYEGIYIGMPAMYHAVAPCPKVPNTVGFHLVQLVCSRDLKNWKRLGDRKPFIGPSPLGGGAYDLTQIIGPSAPVARGDELWFYYTGIKTRSSVEEGYVGPELDPDQGAICLAVLRRDGFISLDAGEQEGMLLTKPFKLFGSKLYVNVDAWQGEISAEVMDVSTGIMRFESRLGKGKVLAASAPLKGNLHRGLFAWEKGDLAELKEEIVSLRFRLRNAQFYSFWLDD